MNNNKQSSVRWVVEELEKFELGESEFFSKTAIVNHADRMHKEEMVTAHSTGLPIDDGVFTAIDKGHKYYDKTFNNYEQ